MFRIPIEVFSKRRIVYVFTPIPSVAHLCVFLKNISHTRERERSFIGEKNRFNWQKANLPLPTLHTLRFFYWKSRKKKSTRIYLTTKKEKDIYDAIDRIASNNVLDDLCCCGSFIVENSKTNSCQLSIIVQKKHHRPENFGAPRAGLHREIWARECRRWWVDFSRGAFGEVFIHR